MESNASGKVVARPPPTKVKAPSGGAMATKSQFIWFTDVRRAMGSPPGRRPGTRFSMVHHVTGSRKQTCSGKGGVTKEGER